MWYEGNQIAMEITMVDNIVSLGVINMVGAELRVAVQNLAWSQI